MSSLQYRSDSLFHRWIPLRLLHTLNIAGTLQRCIKLASQRAARATARICTRRRCRLQRPRRPWRYPRPHPWDSPISRRARNPLRITRVSRPGVLVTRSRTMTGCRGEERSRTGRSSPRRRYGRASLVSAIRITSVWTRREAITISIITINSSSSSSSNSNSSNSSSSSSSSSNNSSSSSSRTASTPGYSTVHPTACWRTSPADQPRKHSRSCWSCRKSRGRSREHHRRACRSAHRPGERWAHQGPRGKGRRWRQWTRPTRGRRPTVRRPYMSFWSAVKKRVKSRCSPGRSRSGSYSWRRTSSKDDRWCPLWPSHPRAIRSETPDLVIK